MDFKEGEDAAQKKRRAEVVEFRNKKRNSTLFTVVASVYEIVVSLLVILVLFVLVSLLFFKVFKLGADGAEGGGILVYEILLLVIFVGGIIIGFFIYKATARFVIKKYNLKDKLLESVTNHYLTKQEAKEKEKERRRS